MCGAGIPRDATGSRRRTVEEIAVLLLSAVVRLAARMKQDGWFLLAIVALCLTLGALEFAYYSSPPKGPSIFSLKR